MSPSSAPRKVWEIFCRIVDNLGDIGVCWRLARQLAAEHAFHVRLWVDRPESLALIAPQSVIGLNPFENGLVEVIPWTPEVRRSIPGEVVIEAFACELPEEFIAAMLQSAKPPLWINLEYLSAERWIEGCHLLPSPHPASGLAKHFFFPGFGPGSGGLLCESGLIGARTAFQSDRQAEEKFWRMLGVKPPPLGALKVSLFCYENRALAELLDCLLGDGRAIHLMVPEGRVLPQLSDWCGSALASGERYQRGGLVIQVLPFVGQPLYDRLLWACDLNFVRGEDSLVRALWAGRPFVWQAYLQQDDLHLVKLEALLERCLARMPLAAAGALGGFSRGWNLQQGVSGFWPGLSAELETIGAALEEWSMQIRLSGDLATNLVSFSKSKLK